MGASGSAGTVEAVVFDMDGVLLDSEQVWDEVRAALARERGGRWHERAHREMMGMSSPEWSRYMHERIGLPESPAAINAEVVRRLIAHYAERLPLLPGAVDAVRRIAARWPLGLASSSNREVIEMVLRESGLVPDFNVTVSSEEVARGKPAPDVYEEACSQLGVEPGAAAAIEDSCNGISSARAAGLRVIAIPNQHFPPGEEALSRADEVIEDLGGLTPGTVDPAA